MKNFRLLNRSESRVRLLVSWPMSRFLSAFFALCWALTGHAQSTYSASGDYSLVSGNPNGVWEYGYSATLGDTFSQNPIAMDFEIGGDVFQMWTANVLETLCPHITKNQTDFTIAQSTTVVDPRQMVMHPGPNGEYSVLRFRAPCCGDYRFDAAFIGVDWVGTTTDVHVLKNGVPIWSGSVNGYQNGTSTTGSVHLECGDTLEVAVGPGSNGHYFFDTTGVVFDVQATATSAMQFDGFLAPLGGADSTGGTFSDTLRTIKFGSTLPLKFKLSCCENDVLDGIHTLQAIKYSNAIDSDPPIDATPTDAATTGNQFRLTGNQWHFNLDTGGLSKGTWKLVATLSDGSQHYVWITLK